MTKGEKARMNTSNDLVMPCIDLQNEPIPVKSVRINIYDAQEKGQKDMVQLRQLKSQLNRYNS